MEGMDIYKTKNAEFCSCCRKQGKNYTNVVVGIMRLPFCDDCYEQFKQQVAKGATREVVGS